MPRNKARERYLLRTYDITIEQYNQFLIDQGGGCAVCHKTPKEEGRNLAVDHDHKTGEIYGLLCMRCNHRLIGRIRDPYLFYKAWEYLDAGGYGLFVPPKNKKKRKKRS